MTIIKGRQCIKNEDEKEKKRRVRRSREMTIIEDKDYSNNSKRMYNGRGRRRGE